ncbi:MAG: actin-binding WH2 domain-containing protein [Moorea sp. SIO2B7]|nr:actin-binding WH2 domain-containing protein [Moorena sp. SIO2B7]
MNHFAILMQFLRNRLEFLEEIKQGVKLEKKIISLLISSSIFFAIYGGIMGSISTWMQIFVSAIKLPALYLLTLIICLPTLYFFDIIVGSKRIFAQYVALLLASMSIISVLLFGFVPVILFFRISINDPTFFKLLNVAILGVTGVFGVHGFYRGMISFKPEDSETQKTRGQNSETQKTRELVIRSWLVLYGFVGSQLGWTLRPFFGDANQPFALFRQLESNFYVEIFKLIGQLFS